MNCKKHLITASVFSLGLLTGILCNEYTHIEWWEDKQLILTEADFMRSSTVYAKTQTPQNVAQPVQHSPQVLEILRIIRIKESSNGTKGLAITCKKFGKSNEYGYNVPHCYNSHEELTELIAKTFEKRLQELSLPQAICRYNTGKVLDDCPYWRDYQTYL
jgi:hypothetical protein